MFAMIFSLFMTSYIPYFLFDEIEIPKTQNGYYIAIWASFYTISAFLVGPLTKKISSSFVSLGSYILIGIGCLFFGPSKILDIFDNDYRKARCKYYNDLCLDLVKPQGHIVCDVMTTDCTSDRIRV
jgi:hypothetical protein